MTWNWIFFDHSLSYIWTSRMSNIQSFDNTHVCHCLCVCKIVFCVVPVPGSGRVFLYPAGGMFLQTAGRVLTSLSVTSLHRHSKHATGGQGGQHGGRGDCHEPWWRKCWKYMYVYVYDVPGSAGRLELYTELHEVRGIGTLLDQWPDQTSLGLWIIWCD